MGNVTKEDVDKAKAAYAEASVKAADAYVAVTTARDEYIKLYREYGNGN